MDETPIFKITKLNIAENDRSEYIREAEKNMHDSSPAGSKISPSLCTSDTPDINKKVFSLFRILSAKFNNSFPCIL